MLADALRGGRVPTGPDIGLTRASPGSHFETTVRTSEFYWAVETVRAELFPGGRVSFGGADILKAAHRSTALASGCLNW